MSYSIKLGDTMKQRFTSKKKKKRISIKLFFFLLLFSLGIYISYQQLSTSKIKLNQKQLVDALLKESNHHNKTNTNIFTYLLDLLMPIKKVEPVTLLEENYQNLVITEEAPVKVLKEETPPLIYIYNTHQTEEYSTHGFIENSITPTVQMNNYILEEVFSKNNKTTIVEEQSIKGILNQNSWKYNSSYKASRILLEQAKQNHPTLTYFIDVHRDSLKKDRTTVTINDKNYAKILFIVGMENKNHQQNLEFTTKINNKLEEKYPNLSKGIYKKEGEGVNGVYNQDFSPYTILVEMGGPENTVDEVLNTSLAFAECFLEVINTNESKRHN